MYEGAVFAVRQDESSGTWTLIALDPSKIPTLEEALNSGNQLGSFDSPDGMCREITAHVQKTQESQRSGGGSEQRV